MFLFNASFCFYIIVPFYILRFHYFYLLFLYYLEPKFSSSLARHDLCVWTIILSIVCSFSVTQVLGYYDTPRVTFSSQYKHLSDIRLGFYKTIVWHYSSMFHKYNTKQAFTGMRQLLIPKFYWYDYGKALTGYKPLETHFKDGLRTELVPLHGCICDTYTFVTDIIQNEHLSIAHFKSVFTFSPTWGNHIPEWTKITFDNCHLMTTCLLTVKLKVLLLDHVPWWYF